MVSLGVLKEWIGHLLMILWLVGWLGHLMKTFDEEVKEAVFSCDGCKAPGPDGFTLNPFQQCWDNLKQDLMLVFHEFYQNGIVNVATNETFVCLVPKKLNSCKIMTFDP